MIEQTTTPAGSEDELVEAIARTIESDDDDANDIFRQWLLQEARKKARAILALPRIRTALEAEQQLEDLGPIEWLVEQPLLRVQAEKRVKELEAALTCLIDNVETGSYESTGMAIDAARALTKPTGEPK